MTTTPQTTPRAADAAVKAFREYLAVHEGSEHMYAHTLNDMAQGLARIALDFHTPAPSRLLQICEPAAPARAFPAMTPELERILGTMCFETIKLARILRADGQAIATRAEVEQAAVLHWMLSLWSVHGEEWRKAAVKEVERMREAFRAAQGSEA